VRKGQNVLKVILAIEFLYFLVYNSLIVLGHQIDGFNTNTGKVEQFLIYFQICVQFWLFFGCIYFLWPSINRSIVVELISYTLVLIIMNLYFMWRMVDDMWVEHMFQNDFDQDEASDS